MERRGLVLIDPPYEETARDFERARSAIGEVAAALRHRRDHALVSDQGRARHPAWRRRLRATLRQPDLVSELWVHPCDSRIALNGSGLIIIHPPYQLAQRMRVWLPQLLGMLEAGTTGGWLVEAQE